MLLQALLELLDRLHADALDAKEILLGVAHQIGDRFDARLAELVGPTLRNAQVVEDVQARILVGKLRTAMPERQARVVVAVARPH